MNRTDAGSIALKLAGLYASVLALLMIPQALVFPLLISDSEPSLDSVFWLMTGFPFLLLLAVGGVLLWKGDALAQVLFPVELEAQGPPLRQASLLALGISLIGLWLTVTGLVTGLTELDMRPLKSIVSAEGSLVLESLLRVVVGLLLFLKSEQVSNYWRAPALRSSSRCASRR